MRGRKPKPQLYLVDSDDDPNSNSRRKHKPPTCPAHLSPTAKTEWKKLIASLHLRGIIGDNDRAVLAAYCQTYGPGSKPSGNWRKRHC